MNIAIIPARGGSKRIPRKNIKEFAGKPMIVWSIQVAIECRCFEHVIVSTDDEEIAGIAKTHGAEVPFIRSAELSDDYTATIPVIAHAIHWCNANGLVARRACCIYATAPFLRAVDLKRGLQVLNSSGANYAFSITDYAYPIQRAFRITEEQRVQMFHPEDFNSRSQDLENAWHDAGQFYWGKAEAWLAHEPLFGSNAAPIILPNHRVQDIDTVEDWERAELMYNLLT